MVPRKGKTSQKGSDVVVAVAATTTTPIPNPNDKKRTNESITPKQNLKKYKTDSNRNKSIGLTKEPTPEETDSPTFDEPTKPPAVEPFLGDGKSTPRGRRAKDRQEQYRELFGPFPDSLTPTSVQDAYEQFLHTEYSREALVLPSCSEKELFLNQIPSYKEESEVVRLRVGDKLALRDRMVSIFDFARDGIIVGPTPSESITINEINERHVSYVRNDSNKKEQRTVIEDAACIWVKRNPVLTREMCSTKAAAANCTNLLSVPGRMDQDEDEEYRRLLDLPYQDWHTKQYTPNNVTLMDNNEIPCFVCGESIPHHSNQSTDWCTIALDGQTKHHKTWKNHCKEKHPYQLFHFLYKLHMEDADQHNVKLQVQKMLRWGLDTFPIPSSPFICLKTKKDKTDLLYHINSITAVAISNNDAQDMNGRILKLTCAKKGVNKDQMKESANILLKQASIVLKEIADRLRTFDWVRLSEQVTDYVLWNSLSLFFKRGLYCVAPFPPVIGLHIPDTTLLSNATAQQTGDNVSILSL